MKSEWIRHILWAGGFLFLATSAAVAAPPAASPMPRSSLKRYALPAQYTEAQCNDGSPYSIYFRPGKGEGQKRLVVWFQGGGFCQDDATCRLRWISNPFTKLMSSTEWTETLDLNQGLLSMDPDVSPLAGDAVIFLPYCSSDAFTGSRDPFQVPRLPFDLRFKGADITEAVIDLLNTNPPPGIPSLPTATRVVVAGHSAGTGGVLAHADRFGDTLRGNTDIYAVANAGWLFEYPSMSAEVMAFGGIAPYLGSMADYWEAQVDDDCATHAQTVGTLQARGKCILGESASEYVDTPLFVAMAQQDSALLGLLEPTSNNDMAYAFREALHNASIEGAYSLNNAAHGYLHSNDLLLNSTCGASPKKALEAFLSRPNSSSAFDICP